MFPPGANVARGCINLCALYVKFQADYDCFEVQPPSLKFNKWKFKIWWLSHCCCTCPASLLLVAACCSCLIICCCAYCFTFHLRRAKNTNENHKTLKNQRGCRTLRTRGRLGEPRTTSGQSQDDLRTVSGQPQDNYRTTSGQPQPKRL